MIKKFYVKPITGIDDMDGDDVMASTSIEISEETTGQKGLTGGDGKLHTFDVWDNGIDEE